MAGLTNVNTLAEVQKLVDLCFESNAIVDNIAYQLDFKFGLNKVSDTIHHKIAHAYPITFADTITDFMLLRNDKLYRGAMLKQDRDYVSVVDCFKDLVGIQMNIEDQVKIAVDSAIDSDDKCVEDFLRGFYVDVVVKFTKQAILLLNNVESYSESNLLPLLNANIEDFIIV